MVPLVRAESELYGDDLLGADLNLKKCDAADDGNGIVAELSAAAAAHHIVTR